MRSSRYSKIIVWAWVGSELGRKAYKRRILMGNGIWFHADHENKPHPWLWIPAFRGCEKSALIMKLHENQYRLLLEGKL